MSLNVSFRIMFWHSDNNLYNIAPHVVKGESAVLAAPKHANIPDGDRNLLHEAFVHMYVTIITRTPEMVDFV
jgi:hypothetical protein